MKTTSLALIIGFTLVASAKPENVPEDLIWVGGGAFRHAKSNFTASGVTVSGFYIGKHEVTQKEWVTVMESNPSSFVGDDLPVENVSWYDCIVYCNKRSANEGLQPYYNIDAARRDPANHNEHDDVRWTVTINPGANGYRLPTEVDWEYAASGGQQSRNSTYSGSDDIDRVAWFWQNSGDEPLAGSWHWPRLQHNHNRTHPVGRKEPNELGLHDMSGNVREWCWDWHGDTVQPDVPHGAPRGFVRVWKGGGWMGGDFCCEPSFRGSFEPHSKSSDQGFRICRNP